MGETLFYHLRKEQHIWLKEGLLIPSPKELKGKTDCKWHNLYNHFTANCIVFWQAIQNDLKKCRCKLVDKGAIEMAINTNPFPKLDINMVNEQPTTKGKKMK